MFKHKVLTPELLQAADSCGRSLQKSLALLGLGSLCAELASTVEDEQQRAGPRQR
ncbi:MAG: hypothetical protein LBP55_01905 [Candidatus Adiutrix sp.]|nr:hypothetical protein [Candidatus Adiutrix sp.]